MGGGAPTVAEGWLGGRAGRNLLLHTLASSHSPIAKNKPLTGSSDSSPVALLRKRMAAGGGGWGRRHRCSGSEGVRVCVCVGGAWRGQPLIQAALGACTPPVACTGARTHCTLDKQPHPPTLHHTTRTRAHSQSAPSSPPSASITCVSHTTLILGWLIARRAISLDA